MILEYNDQPAQDKIDFLRSNPTTAGLPAVVGLLPFTVFSTFLVAIAGDASADEAFVGTLRGLGGVAALVTGLAVAPLLARWRSPRTAAVGLVLLSVAALAGCVATVPALVVFCLGVGAATAVLTPALLHVATASFAARADGARAATLVTAFQSLGAVLAGPVIGALAWWLGWRGVLLMTSVLALVLAAGLLRSSSVTTAARAPAAGYRQAWSRLRSRPDLVGEAFTLVWTLSGTSFWSSPRPGSSSP
nr:MFS transporter [Isoptericola halotolerans]